MQQKVNKVSGSTQLADSVRLINERYITTRKKFLRQYPGGAYTTVTGKMLTDQIIRDHLAGKYTVGIFHALGSGQSKYLLFDVDISNEDQQLMDDITKALIQDMIKRGIPENSILVNRSGNKGYHVVIFFLELTSGDDMLKFAKPIQAHYHSGVCNIETRPESQNSGKGVKLPSGIHQKTGNPCHFIPNDLKDIIDTTTALARVVPLDKEAFKKLVPNETKPQARRIKNPIHVKPEQRSSLPSAESLYNDGLPGVGTRYHATWKTALWVKEKQGIENADELYKSLYPWSMEQVKRKKTRATESEIKKYLRSTCQYIYENNCIIWEPKLSDVPILRSVADILFKLNESDSIRRVALAFIMQSILVNAADTFFYSIQDLKKDTGLSNNTTIKNAIDFIQKQKLIEVVNKGNFNSRKATVYRLTAELSGDPICSISAATSREVSIIITPCYSLEESKAQFSQRQAVRILTSHL